MYEGPTLITQWSETLIMIFPFVESLVQIAQLTQSWLLGKLADLQFPAFLWSAITRQRIYSMFKNTNQYLKNAQKLLPPIIHYKGIHALFFNSSHPDVFSLIYLKYIPVKTQLYFISSIIHVASCFDSRSHHQANHWTISEVPKEIAHILG